MNPRNWFRVSEGTVLAVALLFAGSSWLVNTACAQSEPAAAEATPGYTSHAPFLAAPSLSLSGALTSVATADLNGDGKLDLITTDWNSGTVTVSLGLGNGKFATGIHYAAGANPGTVVLADVDGDGRPDAIVSNTSAGTISVLRGNGGGALQALRSYHLGFNPTLIVTGDLNGDGKTDIVAYGATSNVLAVLLNDGQGSFSKPVLHSVTKASSSLAVADFNNDGHADLALAHADGTVTILLGGGDGSFRITPDVKVASGPISSVSAGDFNKDGNIDLAVTLATQKQLSILMGKGDGGFTSGAAYRVGSSPVSITLGDVDEDGIPDLIVTNQGSNTFSVLGGNGDGTFRSSIDYVAGKGPLATVVGDFDGDGHPDLAIVNHDSQTVSLPLGNGDGTFRAARAYTVELQPKAVASGDLTGHKTSDLVVTNFCGSDASCAKGGTVSVLMAGPNGSYSPGSTYALGSGPVAVALLDVDGDKNPDIVALNRIDKTISILLGIGGDAFQQQFTLPLGESPIAFAVGDFNHDGKSDLAVLGDCGSAKCSQPGTLEILYGGGNGNFRSVRSYPVDFTPTALAVGDLNNDKNLDIIVSNACGKASSCNGPGSAKVFLGGANNTFTAGRDISLGNSPASIALGDLRGSKVLDLLVSRSADNAFAVLRGNGDGTFQAPVTYKVGTTPGPVAIADFNGDGHLDVAVGNVADSTVSVFFGKGDGTLLAGTTLPVGPGPESLTAFQGAGSGRASLVTANGNSTSSAMGTDVTVLANIHPEVVGVTPSSVALVSAPASPKVNDAITLTATVTGTAAGAPTGSVTFTSTPDAITDCNGTASNVVNLTGATATTATAACITHVLQAPSEAVVASYGGDATYNISHSSTSTVAVTPLTSSLALTPTSGSVAVNGSVTFNAALTVPSNSPIAPTGTVSFKVNGSSSADCPDVAVTASPSCTTNALTVGHGTVSAAYTGDANFTSATASSTVTVTPIAATISMSAVTPTPTVGQSVTFTAIVSASSITPTSPSGNVTFTINGSSAGGCVTALNSAGKASCTTTALVAPADNVAATYPGDANFTVAVSTVTVPQTVKKAVAQTTLTSSLPVSSTVNESVTFTATVAPPAGAATTIEPGGSVTFFQGATTLCGPVTLSSAQPPTATCAHAFSAVSASTTITATYNGDTNFSSGAPGSFNQDVKAADTQISLSAVPASPNLNQNVVFTATLVGVPAGSAIPSAGTVVFKDTSTSTTLCTVTITTPGVVPTCSAKFSTAGTHNVTAAYTSADPNFNSSTSSAFAVAVGAGGTTVTISSSLPLPAGSAVNQQVTFSSTVTSSSGGSAVPQGSVIYKDTLTNTNLCTVTLSSGAVPDCTVALTSAGTHTITASFTTSDANFTNGTSSALFQLVNATATTTAVTSAPSTSSVNQSVKFTATIAPAFTGTAHPTGTVAFTYSANGNTLTLCGSPQSVSTSGSTTTATCTAPLIVSGVLKVTATYASGDSNFSASSGFVTQQVNKTATTAAVVSANPSPSGVNQSVSFTASVTPAIPDAGLTQPTGTVTIADSVAGMLCTSVLATNGTVPPCSAPLLTKGTHSITATYAGDTNFTASPASVVFSQVVSAATTQISVSSSSPTADVNEVVVFSSTISITPSGSALPTAGTVTVSDTLAGITTTLCTNPISAGAIVPGCSASFSTPGTHIIIAAFTSADPNFGNSTSPPLNQIVRGTGTSVVLSSSPNPSAVNQPVTFSAAVLSSTSGTAVPQGNVAYKDGSTVLCTNNLAANGSVPACTVPLLTAGTHTITAVFTSTTPSFTGASSTVLNQVVNPPGTTVSVTTAPASSVVDQLVTFTGTITPAFAGNTNPTGTVTFTYTLGGNTITLCNKAEPVQTTGTSVLVTSASCTAPIPAAGSYVITATYVSGDTNFTAGPPATTTQSVTPGTTTVVLSANSVTPSPSAVNQSLTFTAVVKPAISDTGLTPPSGTVTFFDAVAGQLCTSTMTNGEVNGCQAPLGTSGDHNITAIYNGDGNFKASAASNILTQAVNPTATTVTVASSNPVSIATNQVTFTASIKPAFVGTAPTGTVTFSLAQGANVYACIGSPATVVANGTAYTANCSVVFPSTASGAISVSAVYSGDPNFVGSTGNTSQTVQNFVLAFSTPGPIHVTQGYANSSDPFQPVTITAISTPSSGFSDTLSLTCVVTNSNGQTVSDPSCTPARTTLAASGGTPPAYTFSASPTAATGAYTVTLSGVAQTTTTLSQSTAMTVFVVGLSGPLSLSPGASGSEKISFNTVPATSAALTSLGSFNCTGIVFAPDGPPSSLGAIKCTFPSSTVPVVNGSPTTMVPITIAVESTIASAAPVRSNSIASAALWGVPLLALLAWFTQRKSSRRNFFRFIGMLLLIVGIGHAIGCGGHFNPPTLPTSPVKSGNYLVQVVATGDDGQTYYAVVPLSVN